MKELKRWEAGDMCVSDLNLRTNCQSTPMVKQQLIEDLQHTINNIPPSDVLFWVTSMHVLDVAYRVMPGGEFGEDND